MTKSVHGVIERTVEVRFFPDSSASNPKMCDPSLGRSGSGIWVTLTPPTLTSKLPLSKMYICVATSPSRKIDVSASIFSKLNAGATAESASGLRCLKSRVERRAALTEEANTLSARAPAPTHVRAVGFIFGWPATRVSNKHSHRMVLALLTN